MALSIKLFSSTKLFRTVKYIFIFIQVASFDSTCRAYQSVSDALGVFLTEGSD